MLAQRSYWPSTDQSYVWGLTNASSIWLPSRQKLSTNYRPVQFNLHSKNLSRASRTLVCFSSSDVGLFFLSVACSALGSEILAPVYSLRNHIANFEKTSTSYILTNNLKHFWLHYRIYVYHFMYVYIYVYEELHILIWITFTAHTLRHDYLKFRLATRQYICQGMIRKRKTMRLLDKFYFF